MTDQLSSFDKGGFLSLQISHRPRYSSDNREVVGGHLPAGFPDEDLESTSRKQRPQILLADVHDWKGGRAHSVNVLAQTACKKVRKTRDAHLMTVLSYFLREKTTVRSCYRVLYVFHPADLREIT